VHWISTAAPLKELNTQPVPEQVTLFWLKVELAMESFVPEVMATAPP
jgi:hypothetical protein